MKLANRIATALSGRQIQYSVFTENWPPVFTGFSDAWIVGGDGTLNFFVNHYREIRLPLVIFKGGTGNDFHWLLYGDKSFDEHLQIALDSPPRAIDAGRCNDLYFINGAGIGFEGSVAKALTGKKKMAGKTSFLLTILKKIFRYRSKNYAVRAGDLRVSGKKLLVDISNGRRAGGGFHIAPEARADDGLLDVVIAGPLNAIQRLRYLPVIEKGRHLRLSFIRHFKAKHIVVESDSIIQYHLDGEYYEAGRLDIELLAGRFMFRY